MRKGLAAAGPFPLRLRLRAVTVFARPRRHQSIDLAYQIHPERVDVLRHAVIVGGTSLMLAQELVQLAQGPRQGRERAGGPLHLARRHRPRRKPRDGRLDRRQHARDRALQPRHDLALTRRRLFARCSGRRGRIRRGVRLVRRPTLTARARGAAPRREQAAPWFRSWASAAGLRPRSAGVAASSASAACARAACWAKRRDRGRCRRPACRCARTRSGFASILRGRGRGS